MSTETPFTVPPICRADPACVCSELECSGHPDMYPWCRVCDDARRAAGPTEMHEWLIPRADVGALLETFFGGSCSGDPS